MEIQPKISTAVYRQISLDIAKGIVSGRYTEGQKIFGRSVLASQYKVSPETIRKAVHILKDVGILDTEKGSGVEVISVAKAQEFISRYNEFENITSVKSEINLWAQNQIKDTADIVTKIQFILDSTERFKIISPFTPFELKITSDSTVIGKTADQLRFWHNTGGTIIAISRNDKIIISPGPYSTFMEGDIFYMIGTEQSFSAAKKLLYE